MCAAFLRDSLGERIEFGVRTLVHVKSRNVRGDLELFPFVGRHLKIEQVALLSEMVRWRVPRRKRDRLDGFRRRSLRSGKNSLQGGSARDLVLGQRVLLFCFFSANFCSDGVVERQSSADTLEVVNPITCGSEQLP